MRLNGRRESSHGFGLLNCKGIIEKYKSLTDTDLREAVDAAKKIGDDYLQKQAKGYACPETFTHGTSEQRMYWLKKGFESGDWDTTTFE